MLSRGGAWKLSHERGGALTEGHRRLCKGVNGNGITYVGSRDVA